MKLTLGIFRALAKFVGTKERTKINRIKFECGNAIATNGSMAVIIGKLHPMEIFADDPDWFNDNSEFALEMMDTDKLKSIDPCSVLGELAKNQRVSEEYFLTELQESGREEDENFPDIEKLMPDGNGVRVRVDVGYLASIVSLLQACECESVNLVVTECNKPVMFTSNNKSVRGLLMPIKNLD